MRGPTSGGIGQPQGAGKTEGAPPSEERPFRISVHAVFWVTCYLFASIFKMMDVSQYRSVDTLRGYVGGSKLFNDHAGAGLL